MKEWNEKHKLISLPTDRVYPKIANLEGMNEVKPLFDKNNETNYIATEANVKPIYTADMKRNYRSEIVDCNYEIHKSPSLEERWEKAVKEFLRI